MKLAVVAFGGNAFTGEDGRGTYESCAVFAEKISGQLAEIVKSGYGVVVTHGNGPQVGNLLIQQELGRDLAPPMPTDVCVSMTQGHIGYMIVRTLRNHLERRGLRRPVAAVLTQVVVDGSDEAFSNPTKFVGPFFDRQEAESLSAERKWEMKRDSNRGYRRVLPSPKPLDIVEKREITHLLEKGFIVVACGGGGVPVVRGKDGELRGAGGVIDKDLVSAKLASTVSAETLLIITQVEHISLFFGTPRQENITRMTMEEAEKHLIEGHFPPGSVGPKMEAAINFLRDGGKRALITSAESAAGALEGKKGTEITRSLN